MFLILERRTVAHGDDDWYTFEIEDPIGVVNTQEEAEKYIAAIKAKYEATVEAIKQGVLAHNRAWKDANPKPVGKPFIASPKWGVVKNADITPEMRIEREQVKRRNEEIDRQNRLERCKWLDDLLTSEAAYLEAHKKPKQRHLFFQEIQQLMVDA